MRIVRGLTKTPTPAETGAERGTAGMDNQWRRKHISEIDSCMTCTYISYNGVMNGGRHYICLKHRERRGYDQDLNNWICGDHTL